MGRLVILSGAGLSAESGIPTFRDKNGLWENHRIEDVCNYHTWERNYDLVHHFYNERRILLGTVEPNAAHRQIARWEALYPTVILTQNIDDLLERAGCREVAHLHGFLTRMRCFACGRRWEIGYRRWEANDTCPGCGSRARVKPDVVFFGEAAPMYTYLYETLDSLTRDDVLLVVGTRGNVLPIDAIARSVPGTKILNNLAPSEEIDERHFDHVFFEPATQAFPKIDGVLRELLGR